VRPTRRAVLAAPLVLALPAKAAPGDAYAALLAEEHAAIHLYGVLGPRLPESLREYARAAYDDHRRHRDALVEAIRKAGGTPAPPRVTYGLPAPVDGPVSARALAIRIEDSLALRWHAAVGEVAPGDRARVAAALADEAAHLTRYRRSAGAGIAQAAPPFPGR
jgi:hypothetical protein